VSSPEWFPEFVGPRRHRPAWEVQGPARAVAAHRGGERGMRSRSPLQRTAPPARRRAGRSVTSARCCGRRDAVIRRIGMRLAQSLRVKRSPARSRAEGGSDTGRARTCNWRSPVHLLESNTDPTVFLRPRLLPGACSGRRERYTNTSGAREAAVGGDRTQRRSRKDEWRQAEMEY
jgi:hypothetical protein